MHKKYRISLSADERQQLQTWTKRGQAHVRAVKRAQMLLKADAGPEGPGWTDEQIGAALDTHKMTVAYVRRRYCEQGLEAVLHGRYTGHNPAIVTGEVEAQLVALACSAPPQGHERWTLNLLAERLVTLSVVEHISDETVRLALKKTCLSPGASKSGALHPKRTRPS